MAGFSLTDEEKSKLEILLSNIDDEEFQQEEKVEFLNVVDEKEFEEFETSTQECINGFKLTPDEQVTMNELEAKMQKIVDEFPKQLEDETEQKTFEDPLQNAVESGRLWKFADMNERIKDIDKKLESLTALDYDHYDGKERTDSNSKEEH